MLKSLIKITLLLLFITLLFYTLIPATQAQLKIDEYSSQIAKKAGYQTGAGIESHTFLDTTLGKTIAIILGLVGIIFFILILFSGFQWMTAGGNEDKAKQARDRVISATVGLLIIIVAYIISYFVYTAIQTASEGGEPAQLPAGYECQNNSDCVTKNPNQPWCAKKGTYSFCTVCTQNEHCRDAQQPYYDPNKPYCCRLPFTHYCTDSRICVP